MMNIYKFLSVFHTTIDLRRKLVEVSLASRGGKVIFV